MLHASTNDFWIDTSDALDKISSCFSAMALHDGKTVCRTSRWRSKRAFVLGLLLATHWNRRLKSTFSLGTSLRATKLPDAVVDDSGWVALCIAFRCHQYMGHCGTMDDTIYWESWNRTFQGWGLSWLRLFCYLEVVLKSSKQLISLLFVVFDSTCFILRPWYKLEASQWTWWCQEVRHCVYTWEDSGGLQYRQRWDEARMAMAWDGNGWPKDD